MKKCSILLGLICLFSFLAADTWTVLVYMAADNDLSEQALLNLQQMEEAIQPANLNLIVQVDFANSGAKRYKIAHHPQAWIGSTVIQNLATIDSGDPTTLQDFINWGFERYPAQRKMLIIWSHADSWYDWYSKSKYIAPDLDSGNAIGVANGDLGRALAGSPHLDILLFDACSMQSIEIAFELRNYADYIIGSADLVPVKGFPYAAMIPHFALEPSALAAAIPQLYTDSYLPGSQNNPSQYYLTTTCSSVKSAELYAFYTRFSVLVHSLFQHSEALISIREQLYEMNSGYADVDLNQFLHRLAESGVETAQCQSLIQALEHLILASSYTLYYPEEDLKSLAIWFPDIPMNLENVWEVYMQLGFARSQWLSVVNAALAEDSSAPSSPGLMRHSQRHGKLVLSIQCPPDIDSLYYHLLGDHADYYVSPPAYAAEFTTTFTIDSPGTVQIYAIDRVGNRSEPFGLSYIYEQPMQSLVIRPNPVSRSSAVFMDWFSNYPENQNYDLRLYNTKGQRVIQYAFFSPAQQTGSIRLDDIAGFHSLARGLYFIELRSTGLRLRGKLAIM